MKLIPTNLLSSLPFTTTPDPLKDSRHQILNDTSLASVIDSNNDRHLFFQENTGVIRHLWYLDSSWKTSVDFTAASDAKNHTPMAAVIAESYVSRLPIDISSLSFSVFGTCLLMKYIALIYINNTNFITCQGLTNGKWEPCPWPPDSEHPRAAAVGSRHLSAIQFSGNASEFLTVHGANVSYQTILFYESEEFVTTAFVETATYTNMLSSIYSWTQLRLPDFMDYTSLDTPKTNYTIPFALTRARYDDSQSFLFLSNVNTSFPQSFLGSFDADDGNFVRGTYPTSKRFTEHD